MAYRRKSMPVALARIGVAIGATVLVLILLLPTGCRDAHLQGAPDEADPQALSSAEPPGARARLADRLQAYTTAWREGDADAMSSMTHPSLVKEVGGRRKHVEMFRAALLSIEQHGIARARLTMQSPNFIVTENRTCLSLMEYSIPVDVEDRSFTICGVLGGVSEDNGSTWTFVDVGSPSARKHIVGLFPDLLRQAEAEQARRASAEDIQTWVRRLGPAHDPWARTRSVKVLGRVGRRAVPALGKALTHEDAEARAFAAEALGLIGPEAQPAASALAAMAEDDPEESVRSAAKAALRSLRQRTPEP
jgi:hypothetical protein